jgi:hypothetical protein
MPPVVAAAIVTGIAGAGTATIAAKSQSGANKRAIEAQERAAARAEAAAREEDALNRADAERRDAEDRRRWEVEQANLARRQAQDDERLAYEDQIRYGKMVNLARLTGQPLPPPLPRRGGGSIGSLAADEASHTYGAPIMSRPSRANASIPSPGAFPASPLSAEQPMRPMTQLVGRRRVI